MSDFTKDELELIYDKVSEQLDALMNGDWCVVRQEVGKMHGLLSKVIALMEQGKMSALRFKAVGDLPAPAGHPALRSSCALITQFFEVDRKGAIAFRDEHQDSKDTAYTFTPMKPQYWHSWTALAWEDCEVGHGWISACTPDGERFSWEVSFAHDGDPRF